MKKNNKINKAVLRILMLILSVFILFGSTFTIAAENDTIVIPGRSRDELCLNGSWDWFAQTEEEKEDLPEELPEILSFDNTSDFPSYERIEGNVSRIWYKKSFTLVNRAPESVIIDFGTDSSKITAAYVNGRKCDGINISSLLTYGENTLVLVRDDTKHFTDSINLIFSNAPVISSVTYSTDMSDASISFEISLLNTRNADIKTDISVSILDDKGEKRGGCELENIEILSGSSTYADIKNIKIKDFAAKNTWTYKRPYLYSAKIEVFGDTVTIPFAMRPDGLFESENYRYGVDIVVSEFFANENNKGHAWNEKWVTAFFKLIKDFNWNVVTYRGGNLPEIWYETALKEGVLIVDKNDDEDWAKSQETLWSRENDFLLTAQKLKDENPDGIIVPVLYSEADTLFSDDPALKNISKIRVKNIFSTNIIYNTPVKKWGFFKGIAEYFKEMINKTFIRDNRYKLFLKGIGNTLLVALASTAFGVVIGMIIAVIKVSYAQCALSKKKNVFLSLINVIAEVYTTVIRGTPVVVQLLITYNVIFVFSDKAVMIGIFAFSINSGAYISEIIRAGINSIDRGQTEAGRSLGLSQFTTMKSIILPQALKNILPALGNEFIALLKETSVIGYLGVVDLTRAGELVRSRTADAFFTLLFVALVYLVLVFGLSAIFKRLERRMNKSDRN